MHDHAGRLRSAQGICCLLLLLPTALPTSLPAQERIASVDQEISMLLEALSYDRNLEEGRGETLRIAVLYAAGDGEAQQEAEAIARSFDGIGKTALPDLAPQAQPFPFESPVGLLRWAEAEGIDAAFVHASLTTALASIQQVSRRKQILTLCNDRKFVERGLSLGVYLHGPVPILAVNLRAARIEGLDLDPAIMLVATIIR